VIKGLIEMEINYTRSFFIAVSTTPPPGIGKFAIGFFA